jgi:uncharacterized protein YecE (DUF72 family)
MVGRTAGRLYVGTSGFAYPAWAPTFYPAHARGDELLPFYASRLPACELNNTFYQQPSETKVRSWLAATPAEFRFAVKAQRGGSIRAIATDPAGSVAWLTGPLRHFGERLGTVLYRVPQDVRRDDDRLAALLAAWPRELPLTMEFQDPGWHVDEVFRLLQEAGAALCATELDTSSEAPTLRVTAPHLYVRLRRTAYAPEDIDRWAARLAPFIDAGHDVYAIFRHDEGGLAPGRALDLAGAVEAVRAAG